MSAKEEEKKKVCGFFCFVSSAYVVWERRWWRRDTLHSAWGHFLPLPLLLYVKHTTFSILLHFFYFDGPRSLIHAALNSHTTALQHHTLIGPVKLSFTATADERILHTHTCTCFRILRQIITFLLKILPPHILNVYIGLLCTLAFALLRVKRLLIYNP